MVRVEVHLRGGERLECTKEAPRGSERDFASAGEITRKFEQLARHALPEARVAELRDAVLGLDKLADAARLADLMSNLKGGSMKLFVALALALAAQAGHAAYPERPITMIVAYPPGGGTDLIARALAPYVRKTSAAARGS